MCRLSTVWVILEAYEQDLPWLRFAQTVNFTTDVAPGEIFTGKIAFIDPIVDPKTRTAKVRVNVENSEGTLRPGVFVRASVTSTLVQKGALLDPDLEGKWISPMHPEIIKDAAGTCDICGMDLVPAEELGYTFREDASAAPLLVPASAVLRTGDRAVVYRREKSAAEDHVQFHGVTVSLGAKVGDSFIVRSGLEESDFVVSRGAFKLDSELQIQGKESMMTMPAAYVGPPIPQNPLDDAVLDKFQSALDHYLQMTGHLAHDRDADATRTVPTLVTALRETGIELLSEAADGLEGKSGRESTNGALPVVTAALADVIRTRAANQLGRPLFLHHCPMALDDTGGDWLHPTRAIENPYFGSLMFACGEVKEQLTVHGGVSIKDEHAGH